jgi:O-methyltransferase
MHEIIRSVLKPCFSALPQPIQESLRERLREQRSRRAAQVEVRRNIAAVRRGERLVPESALEQKFVEALRYLTAKSASAATLGDYLEFGVYNGSSLSCAFKAHNQVGAQHVRLFGFDSFEGLPRDAHLCDHGLWRAGSFRMDERFARKFLTEEGVDWNRVTLVKGWFNETLTDVLLRSLSIRKASILMVDCDTYASTKTVLPFCAPLIDDHAAIFFDDWHADGLAEKNLGEKRAFDEFLEQHPEFTVEDFGDYGNYSKVFIVSRSSATRRGSVFALVPGGLVGDFLAGTFEFGWSLPYLV